MSSLLKKEDYWAIWIGFALLIAGLIIFLANPPADIQKHQALDKIISTQANNAPYKTFAWHNAVNEQQKIKGSQTPIGKWIKTFTGCKPSSWKSNPADAFYLSGSATIEQSISYLAPYDSVKAIVKSLEYQAQNIDSLAASIQYKDEKLNETAQFILNEWLAAKDVANKLKKKTTHKSFNKIPWLIGLMLFLGFLFAIASHFLGTSFFIFFKGFIIVFLLGILAYFLAGQAEMKAIGFGYAAWAIVLGLLISNTIGTPEWLKPALKTELFIKTGLVLLGAEILFGKVLAIGLPGIFVAWIVTPIVLISTYWFGQKVLKISSKTLNMTISADMSVCGVSAAVATAAACKASKEELTLAIGLSMIFTSIMMIALPAFINMVGMPEVLGGAWIGGTIDATGAVVAAGAFLGETALSVAATIKMIQNVLIGLIAFGVAIYFASQDENNGSAKIDFSEVWKRFPKFILGFIGASIVFSSIYEMLGIGEAYSLIDQGVIGGMTKNIRGWLFCLAFVSIGLSTNFKALRHHLQGGKPLILYFCGQLFNILLTLLMAYVMFYLVFPQITASL